MSRQLRIEYPGEYYYVMSQGMSAYVSATLFFYNKMKINAPTFK